MTKIYVSSTYSDLVEHRQRVYYVLRKMRYDVMAMEDYVAADERPGVGVDKALSEVFSVVLDDLVEQWRGLDGFLTPGIGRQQLLLGLG